jgi:hypothetical protein
MSAPQFQQPQQCYYQAPIPQRPVMPVKTNRSLLKYILLGIITLGIYDLVVMTETTNSVNTIVSRYDGRRSMHFLLMFFLFGWLSCGIAWFVWFHRISNRVGNELQRRGYPRLLSASDYWLWYVLGSIIIVGPFIYLFKMFAAVNTLANDYNQRG